MMVQNDVDSMFSTASGAGDICLKLRGPFCDHSAGSHVVLYPATEEVQTKPDLEADWQTCPRLQRQPEHIRQ